MFSKKQERNISSIMNLSFDYHEASLALSFLVDFSSNVDEITDANLRLATVTLRGLYRNYDALLVLAKSKVIAYAYDLKIIDSNTIDKRIKYLIIDRYISAKQLSGKKFKYMNLKEIREIERLFYYRTRVKARREDHAAEAFFADLVKDLNPIKKPL